MERSGIGPDSKEETNMETVEMDLMQAQIAELTTEVTRLQRSAGGEVVVNIDTENETASMSSDEIVAELRKGKKVIGITEIKDADGEPGAYIITYYNVTYVQYFPTNPDESQRCLVDMTALTAYPEVYSVVIDGAKHITFNLYELDHQ